MRMPSVFEVMQHWLHMSKSLCDGVHACSKIMGQSRKSGKAIAVLISFGTFLGRHSFAAIVSLASSFGLACPSFCLSWRPLLLGR
jgi:hypothetical protein